MMRNNGLFYVGSALRFFTIKDDLQNFMASRIKSSLIGKSTK